MNILPSFKYSPLNCETNDIRLVRLLEENSSYVLSCELQHFPSASSPPYLALSYTWGDPKDTVPISLNDRSLNITRNLLSFLQHSRHRSKSPITFSEALWFDDEPLEPDGQWLWIDAICIDQSNIPERNLQVPRMKEIYERAEGVITWLGPASDDSDIAFAVIRSLGRATIRAYKATGKYDPNAMVAVGRAFGRREWDSVQKVFHRPWWNRAWICQEVTTPTKGEKRAMAWCGHNQIDWDYFGIASVYILDAELERALEKSENISNMRIRTLACMTADRKTPGKNRVNDLLYLLGANRDCETSDPRDKIYAFLAISNDGQVIQADYEKPVAAVYTELATTFIKRDRRLDVLGYSCLEHISFDLPSWVPNWSLKSIANRLCLAGYQSDGTFRRTYHANKGLKGSIGFTGGERVLRVKGFVFDSAILVSWSRTFTSLSASEIMLRWRAQGLHNGPNYVTGGTVIDALQHTLCADIEEDDVKLSERGRKVNPFPQDGGEEAAWSTSMPLLRATQNRKLVSTLGHYMGLVPELTEPEDKICILSGASVPFVLREEGNHWVLVGESYIHGIMDGEAVTTFKASGRDMEIFEIW